MSYGQISILILQQFPCKVPVSHIWLACVSSTLTYDLHVRLQQVHRSLLELIEYQLPYTKALANVFFVDPDTTTLKQSYESPVMGSNRIKPDQTGPTPWFGLVWTVCKPSTQISAVWSWVQTPYRTLVYEALRTTQTVYRAAKCFLIFSDNIWVTCYHNR